jgi:hypothetical protein
MITKITKKRRMTTLELIEKLKEVVEIVGCECHDYERCACNCHTIRDVIKRLYRRLRNEV